MRFFADHCVPGSVIRSLRSQRHEVLILREHIPASTPDPAVLATAQRLDAVLVSLNGDFGDIAAYPPHRHKGIIALQVRNRPEALEAIVQRLLDYLARFPEQQSHSGRLVLVEAHRIRVRT